jgi:hypothetical protein
VSLYSRDLIRNSTDTEHHEKLNGFPLTAGRVKMMYRAIRNVLYVLKCYYKMSAVHNNEVCEA